MGELSLLSAQEHASLSHLPVVQHAGDSVLDLLLPRCEVYAEQPAVHCHSKQLSYAELNARSWQLARYLKDNGVSTGTVVGVCLPRNEALLVSLLAVWKAGGVYVPVDPAYPTSRIDYMVADSGMTILLSQSDVTAVTGMTGLLHVDDVAPEVSDTPFALSTQAGDTAYMIYTSGTSGQPKGVRVAHHQLLQTLSSVNEVMGVTAQDRMAALASHAFDISLLELLLPLLNGASVELVAQETIRDVAQLASHCQQVSILHAVPGLMKSWLEQVTIAEQAYPALRYLLVGGEAVPAELIYALQARFPAVEIIEFYGPTENTIVSSYHRKPRDGQLLGHCIGETFAHVQAYVVDRQGQLCVPGAVGELYLGGYGVSQGYHQREELSSEVFIADTFSARTGGRLYRTGDLVRRLVDGTLLYLGRADKQMKLRGYRVEPGEIESALLSVAEVEDAVVFAEDSADGESALVACLVSHSPEGLEGQCREALTSVLPGYMIPARYLVLEALPRTSHGKLDNAELRRLVQANAASVEYVAPESELEVAIAQMWSSLLGRERVSLTDNFFNLGG
ncbi:amino acid adenylation domain-containing protein, partial [Pseudoalteromonas sp. MMG006]|uniref:amino acid adenylation domain-containing protein n=1 Tax=Pseudoalteromonas sp. MMG006 TaxID=2822683 RepID=UPI001B36800A|nr:amino acid adenylation domain-containing protein [Pseudoalteromonas sp. MMG006]